MQTNTHALVSLDTVALTVFSQTISAYLEHKFSSHGVGATNFNNAGQGKATHTGTTAVIRPSASDFVADVESAARACLSEGELAYFDVYYRCGRLIADAYTSMVDEFAAHLGTWPEHLRSAVEKLDHKIRVKLGAELRRRGIAPVCDYFAPVDVRRGHDVLGDQRAALLYTKATVRIAVAA